MSFIWKNITVQGRSRLLILGQMISIATMLILCCDLAHAEEDASNDLPVKLKAEQIRYVQETGMVYAEGNVRIEYYDIAIRVEKIELDLNTNQLHGVGSAVIKQSSSETRCSEFDMVLDTGQMRMARFNTTVRSPEFVGPAYVDCEDFVDSGNVITGKTVIFTNCDYLRPHFYLTAASFELYPNKRIEASNVVFWENGLPIPAPLFYTPFYVYYFDTRQVIYLFPEVGVNNTYGWYAKNVFDYYYDTGFNGKLKLDWFQKKGWAVGVEHNYEIGTTQKGNLTIYDFEEQDTGISNRTYALKHQYNISPSDYLKGNVNLAKKLYASGSRSDTLQYGLGWLFGRGGSWAGNYSFNKDFQSDNDNMAIQLDRSDSGRKINLSYSLSDPRRTGMTQESIQTGYYQDLFWDMEQQINLSFSKNRINGQIGNYDEQLNSNYKLTHKQTWLYNSLDINYARYIDVDADAVTSDQYYNYINQLPNINVGFYSLDLWLCKLDNSLEAGIWEEARYSSSAGRSRVFTTERYKLSPKLSQSYTLPWGDSFSWSYGLNQILYGPGDAIFIVNESASMSNRWFNCFINSTSWSRSYSDGNSPFYMDTKGGESQQLSEKTTLYYDNEKLWSLSASTGYNWTSAKFSDLSYEALANPVKEFKLSNKVRYSIEDSQYIDWTSSLKLQLSKDSSWTFDLAENLKTGKITKGTSAVKCRLFIMDTDWEGDWYLEFRHQYDTSSQKFDWQRPKSWKIIKDLHCREISLTYDDDRKEWFFLYEVKAFPDQPMGFSNSKAKGWQLEGVIKKAVKWE